jgi:putative SOS response-associated peptidase YedK
MCGRVRLPTDYSEIKIQLRFSDLAAIPNLRASWNLAPTQDLLVAVHDNELGRAPQMMRWGLIPSWSKDDKPKFSSFNARAETIDTMPAFRGAWRHGHRCLIVTDGFYEWRKSDKQPFAIGRTDAKLTIMAGLWEAWRAPGSTETIRSCTVITTAANAMMSEIHDRMPVILSEADWPVWIGEAPATHALKGILVGCPDDVLKMWPVGKAVGNVKNDGPELAAMIGSGRA